MSKKRKMGMLEALALIVVAFGATAFQAFVLFKIWGWFLVPLGLVSIPVATFVGISSILTIASFRAAPEGTPEPSADYQWARVYAVFMLGGICLLFSYLALVFL